MWGYLVDDIMLGKFPTGEELLAESWETIWQTALTTPLLNAFKNCTSKTQKVNINVNGMEITASLADLDNYMNVDGSIDGGRLLRDFAINGQLKGNNYILANNINGLYGIDIVSEVKINDNGENIIKRHHIFFWFSEKTSNFAGKRNIGYHGWFFRNSIGRQLCK